MKIGGYVSGDPALHLTAGKAANGARFRALLTEKLEPGRLIGRTSAPPPELERVESLLGALEGFRAQLLDPAAGICDLRAAVEAVEEQGGLLPGREGGAPGDDGLRQVVEEAQGAVDRARRIFQRLAGPQQAATS